MEEGKMKRNRFREKLNAGQPTLGTHIHSTWPSIIEAVGYTGIYDYVEFVAEYAPYSLYDFDNMCRAAELFGMSTMIKIDQEPRKFVAQRAVGSGFQSVLFADVRTVEDARECIRSVRPETPDDGGLYGAATRRMAYMDYGGGSEEYLQALRDVVVVFMIEKQPTVEALEEILSVEGLDMIQWGGADYSISIGRAGARLSPEVRAIERKVIETGLRMGVPPRAEIGSVDDAKYYLDLGVRHFSLGTDIMIVYNWLKENGQPLLDAISKA
jgi:4-hydroxy-2-oxoheptanedioate aldolase